MTNHQDHYNQSMTMMSSTSTRMFTTNNNNSDTNSNNKNTSSSSSSKDDDDDDGVTQHPNDPNNNNNNNSYYNVWYYQSLMSIVEDIVSYDLQDMYNNNNNSNSSSSNSSSNSKNQNNTNDQKVEVVQVQEDANDANDDTNVDYHHHSNDTKKKSTATPTPTTVLSLLSPIHKQAILLLQQEQYYSCQLLIQFHISSSLSSSSSSLNNNKYNNNNNNEERYNLHILGECYYQQQNYISAKQCYEQLVVLVPNNDMKTNTKLTQYHHHQQQLQYTYRLAQCLFYMKHYIETINVLEAIPIHQRTIPILMLLGDCYYETNSTTTSTSSGNHTVTTTTTSNSSSNSSSSAVIQCYIQVLQINPYMIEAIQKVISMYGYTEKSILYNAIDIGYNNNINNQNRNFLAKNDQQQYLRLMKELIVILIAKYKYQIGLALQLLQQPQAQLQQQAQYYYSNNNHRTNNNSYNSSSILMDYPDNVFLLSIQAECMIQLQYYTSSSASSTTTTTTTTATNQYNTNSTNVVQQDVLYIYERIRYIDHGYIYNMDQYAYLLGENHQYIDTLSDLVDHMFQINPHCSTTWTCLAIYHKCYSDTLALSTSTIDATDSSNTTNLQQQHYNYAIKFIEKAISINQKDAYAHYIRGKILLDGIAATTASSNAAETTTEGNNITNYTNRRVGRKPEYAAVSFFRAIEIQSNNIMIYESLVDAYLAAGKEKEAIAAAKTAYNIAPRDIRTQTLVGVTLLHAGGNVLQGKRSLYKALQINPTYTKALYCLLDILCNNEKDYTKCIELLVNAAQVLEQQQQVQSSTTTTMLSDNNTGTTQSTSLIEEIYCRMGDVYIYMEQYTNAIQSYNTVLLQYNPYNTIAINALDKIDKLLRGIDPNNNNNNSNDHDIEEDDNNINDNNNDDDMNQNSNSHDDDVDDEHDHDHGARGQRQRPSRHHGATSSSTRRTSSPPIPSSSYRSVY